MWQSWEGDPGEWDIGGKFTYFILFVGPCAAYFLNDPFPSFSFFSCEYQQAMLTWARGLPNPSDGQTHECAQEEYQIPRSCTHC